jgi:hypothetical protein
MMFQMLHTLAVVEVSHLAISFIDLDALTAVVVLGFIAAVGLGSVAWYNSKRPVGWEDKERPDIVPKVDKEETPGAGEPKS